MKTCIIIAGLPGSGKSSLARILASMFSFNTKIICTDDYFVNEETGEYEFDVKDLHRNHNKAFNDFKKAVLGRGIEYHTVIVSNTCTQTWEYKRYEDFAKENGFIVFPVIVRKNKEQVYKNLHGVPDEVVDKMQARLVQDFVTPKLKR